MSGFNEMCVLKTTVPVLFVIFTLSAAVRSKLGLSIAQGPFPSISVALGQSAQVREEEPARKGSCACSVPVAGTVFLFSQ